MAWIPAAFKVGYDIYAGEVAADAAEKEGKKHKEAGRQQRIFNDIAAGQVLATGQRSAMEERRIAELTVSRAVAVAGAGGYINDVGHLIADIEGEGAYRASVALYESEQESKRLRWEGRMAEKYGVDLYGGAKARAEGIKLEALGSILNSGLFDNVGTKTST